MSNVVRIDLKIDDSAINLLNKRAVRGLFQMGFDMAAQARRNAPYLTGALRSTIRVQETNSNTVEVIAGGVFGGKRVDYAWIREQVNKAHPDKAHYMEKAKNSIMTGNYIKKYFGDIT